jgi:hypothetical protein
MDSLLAAVTIGEAITFRAIFVIAVGVFLGNLAWGALSGLAKWCFAGAEKHELEETIENAVVSAQSQRSA